MNIEIVDFFSIDKNPEKGLLNGTLRIKLPDLGIHILGIYVSKRKDTWFFNLPSKRAHHETGEIVHYPCFVFEDKEKHRELIDAIRMKGREFIERWLTETKDLIITQEQQPEQAEPAKTQDKAILNKVSVFSAKKPKIFITPPPLKKTFKRSTPYGRDVRQSYIGGK